MREWKAYKLLPIYHLVKRHVKSLLYEWHEGFTANYSVIITQFLLPYTTLKIDSVNLPLCELSVIDSVNLPLCELSVIDSVNLPLCELSVIDSVNLPLCELSGVQYWPGGHGSQSAMFWFPMSVAIVPRGHVCG